MVKKVVLGLVVLIVLAGAGLAVWARSVLATDTVRTTLAAQLAKALGQPVTVQDVHATVYPRITVSLTGVTIGKRSEISVASVDVGTDFRALLSRRIEHAALHVNGARLQLPLPPLALASSERPSSSAPPTGAPLDLVSVDEVVLSGIEIVSRGRTLKGDIDLVPHGTSAVTVRRVSLVADEARIDVTGELTSLAGPVGTLDLKAGALDLDQMMAFVSDFSEGSGLASPDTGGSPSAPATSATRAAAANLAVTLTADKATLAGLSLGSVKGRARLEGETVGLDPLSFTLFGGTYEGTLGATLGSAPAFSWKATVKNIDVGAVTAFAGSPGVLTGHLNGDIDLTGTGIDAASAMKTARGTAKVAVANGTVANLALVRGAVAATSLNPQAVAQASQGPHDEPFSELGATLAIFAGTASTSDLHFISKDIRFDAGGALRLDGSAVTLQGAVQLSEELTKQVNGTVARFTEQDGRITLPATIRGGAGKYSIEVDSAVMARRAVTNEAKAQAQGALTKGIGKLLGR